MDDPRGPRLAGLVMSLLGCSTYCATSPFGLVLSVEKLLEPGRPRRYRARDWLGAGLGFVGWLTLPLWLFGAWTLRPAGPVVVLLYLAFLVGWLAWRATFVWGGLYRAWAEVDDE